MRSSYSTSIKSSASSAVNSSRATTAATGIADMANVIGAERLLVLTDRNNSVLDRQIFPGENEINARMRHRARNIDAEDSRVWMRRPQQFAV